VVVLEFEFHMVVVWFHGADCLVAPGCWSSWGAWSVCEPKGECGNLDGTRYRTRTCFDGSFGERSCEGNYLETGECDVGSSKLPKCCRCIGLMSLEQCAFSM